MANVSIFIAGKKLDLFKTDSVTIVSSIQDITDISRVFDDYSNQIVVPGSKTNNVIFKHYYNASITNGFDARTRKSAIIEIDGLEFRRGSIRLDGCTIANNKIKEYKITFFGNLFSLKDVFGDDTLRDLSYGDLNFIPSFANVKAGATSGLSGIKVIYPLISTKQQWFYNSNSGDSTNEEKLANIAFNGSSSPHGINFTHLRPAVQVRTLIEKIQLQYGVTFSDDFFGGAGADPLDGLYLWFPNVEDKEVASITTKVTNYSTSSNTIPQVYQVNATAGTIKRLSASVDPSIFARATLTAGNSSNVTLKLYKNGKVAAETSGPGNLVVEAAAAIGDEFYAELVIAANSAAKSITKLRLGFLDDFRDDPFIDKNNFSTTAQNLNLAVYAPDLKLIDFISSILKLYNLTVEAQSSTSFKIIPLNDWYSQGKVHDISKYVDFENVTIDRPEIYKRLIYKFQDPKTILADKFKETNGVAYGDLRLDLKDPSGRVLDGEDYEIEVEFEQMVYERLVDLNDNTLTSVTYALSLDRSLSEVLPAAHLFYGNFNSIVTNSVGILNDSGAVEEMNFAFRPTHRNNSTSTSITFGEEVDELAGVTMTKTLFSDFYEDFITDTFSFLRRLFTYEARIPSHILALIKLNDRLVIKNDRYVINSMEADLVTGKVRLELLNDLYALPIFTDEDLLPVEEPEPLVYRTIAISSSASTTIVQKCSLTADTVAYCTTPDDLKAGDIIYSAPGVPFVGGAVRTIVDRGVKGGGRLGTGGILLTYETC